MPSIHDYCPATNRYLRFSYACLYNLCSLQAGPQQRAAMFPGFFSPPSEFSDALFVAHEEYTAHVQTQLEGMMPLLKVCCVMFVHLWRAQVCVHGTHVV